MHTDQQAMPAPDDPALYYLRNFHTALNWVGERYADLLNAEELAFLADFQRCEQAAQALLVRMVMRKGEHFRASKLQYAEIGDPIAAARPLLERGWLSDQAALDAEAISALLRKDELLDVLPAAQRHRRLKKPELQALLCEAEPAARCFADWCPDLPEQVLSLTIQGLCDRLRLLFFGNLAQDWSEFVLAELGIYRYESVAISPQSRAFRQREDLQGYLHLYQLRESFAAGAELPPLLTTLDAFASDNPYLLTRHARLRLQIAQHLEQQGDLAAALSLYQGCAQAEASWRRVRILEKNGEFAAAHALAVQLSTASTDAELLQRLYRALPRLTRKLGLPPAQRTPPVVEARIDLQLPMPAQHSVEFAVREHFQQADAPVYYVENTLLCSLFGLLCWPAIFAPLPGAFFHPFQSGPADLHSGEFKERRAEIFAACFAALDDGSYPAIMRRHFADKYGLQSPFVYWELLDETLLELALLCIPAAHLKVCFERLLDDIRANRAGMPDLIQFYPQQRRYRMIEVKGPGDRLQDNQKRWLAFCALHGLPVEVCYVQWSTA